jgi:uncharacterized repeat protein (TIGR03803 family)
MTNNLEHRWAAKTCAALVLCATASIALRAQTFTTLVSFNGTDGAGSEANLVQGTDGNLYGTTRGGGTNGMGTVFMMTPSGTLSTLYSFCAQSSCADGSQPEGGLVLGSDGNFYGTTTEGGNTGCIGGVGCGTVFKINSAGTLVTLHIFSGGTDGAAPFAGLIQGSDGNFYGTTGGGGTSNLGTVFRITSRGILTTLHSFNGSDGASPYAAVVQGTSGGFYGTTSGAGVDDVGTVFEITSGGGFKTLYTFCSQTNCADGREPVAPLVQAANGSLYGTTEAGGSSGACAGGCGTVFKITPNGALTTLHSFDSTDGAVPTAGLIDATNNIFYGTTEVGGANNSCFGGGCGTVFEITASGSLTTLYNFCSQANCTDAFYPFGGLVQATNGTLYGTTSTGGTGGYGTVFSLAVGLGPFVETVPTSGKVGASVNILGTNLTFATRVTFNGTRASFSVVSGTLITATVPNGATTGLVRVTTPGSTLSSNVPFRILP